MISELGNIDVAQLGFQTGGAAMVGFVMGYAAKMVLKLVMVVFGVQTAFLAYLERQGIISVDWSKVEGFASTAGSNAGKLQGIFDTLLASVPLGGGFTLGAAGGFKAG